MIMDFVWCFDFQAGHFEDSEICAWRSQHQEVSDSAEAEGEPMGIVIVYSLWLLDPFKQVPVLKNIS